MIKILSQNREMLFLVSGIFIEGATEKFDHRFQIKGIVYGGSEALVLGRYWSKEMAIRVIRDIKIYGDSVRAFSMPADEETNLNSGAYE